MSRDIDLYASRYSADYGFEAVMVHYRRELLIQRLLLHKPKTIIEIGCGRDPIVAVLAERGVVWDDWHVVEPAAAFVEACRRSVQDNGLANVTVYEGFFEDVQIDVPDPDMIVCSGLLHEVPSSLEFLQRVASAMGPRTLFHASVPNASSFHRRLAQAMGLISSLNELSARNSALDQRRVFDLGGLVAEIESSGLRITGTGGFLIKPFTHAQMESLGALLSPDVLDGLNVLGQENPDWASEIWAEATF